MKRHAIAILLVLVVAGCGSGPPTGRCTGQVGAISVAGEIDPSSEVHRRYPTAAACGVVPPAVYSWSYGGGALRVVGVSARALSILDGKKTYPVPPSPEATFMVAWEVPAPLPHPDLRSGEVTIGFKLGGRHEGRFAMEFVDGSTASCEFDLPHGTDEGKAPDCPDDDHDDWD